jgi:hypothetical protein
MFVLSRQVLCNKEEDKEWRKEGRKDKEGESSDAFWMHRSAVAWKGLTERFSGLTESCTAI